MPTSAQTTDQIIDDASQTKRQIERRDRRRYPYPMPVKLTLRSPHGGAAETTQHLQALDLSQGGIRVRSRGMFHIGAEGMMELTRSDGTITLVGVCVCHCRYEGNMSHETGFMFIPHESPDSDDGSSSTTPTAGNCT